MSNLSTLTVPVRATALTVLKVPPMYRRPPLTAMSLTRALVLPLRADPGAGEHVQPVGGHGQGLDLAVEH